MNSLHTRGHVRDSSVTQVFSSSSDGTDEYTCQLRERLSAENNSIAFNPRITQETFMGRQSFGVMAACGLSFGASECYINVIICDRHVCFVKQMRSIAFSDPTRVYIYTKIMGTIHTISHVPLHLLCSCTAGAGLGTSVSCPVVAGSAALVNATCRDSCKTLPTFIPSWGIFVGTS